METFSFKEIVSELSEERRHIGSDTKKNEYLPMPDVSELSRAMDLMVKILFPGYFGESVINTENLNSYIGVYLHKLVNILSEQVYRGFGFHQKEGNVGFISAELANQTCIRFISMLPMIKRKLYADIQATYDGDPAAKSLGEIIYCYPGIKALTNYRIAHEMFKLEIPVLPRIIAEMAHSATGIDIHPGAVIGEALAIDHGTGVVIGETCRIGKNVKIYQGVTLGALSFPLDEKGIPIKGIDRHPVIEDNVIIYSGATILGRVIIGKNSVIGGNVWLTHDVPPHSKIMQRKAKENVFIDGSGI